MTEERKQILLELLPRESPYSVELYRQRDDEWKIPAEVNAMAEACHDPAFGQKFIDSFLVLKRPLPATVVETELVRGYCYLRYGNSDPDVGNPEFCAGFVSWPTSPARQATGAAFDSLPPGG